MARYTAVELPGTDKWAVKVGRAHGGTFTFLRSTVSEVQEDAENAAQFLNADDRIRRAAAALDGLSLRQAKDLAFAAQELIDKVQERVEDEDPDWSPTDPWGWRA